MRSLTLELECIHKDGCIVWVEVKVTSLRDQDGFFSTKSPGVGMGLGLSLVKSITASFNGHIEVFNNNKNGATFKVLFPAMKN